MRNLPAAGGRAPTSAGRGKAPVRIKGPGGEPLPQLRWKKAFARRRDAIPVLRKLACRGAWERPISTAMTRFRPCIDLHHGKVKQIVGGSLRDDGEGLKTNFESAHPADYYASLYRRDGLTGGHVIQLGPGNEQAARAALAAFPGGLQIGGGIRPENVESWLDAGASHVIVTSWLFDGEGRFQRQAAQTPWVRKRKPGATGPLVHPGLSVPGLTRRGEWCRDRDGIRAGDAPPGPAHRDGRATRLAELVV